MKKIFVLFFAFSVGKIHSQIIINQNNFNVTDTSEKITVLPLTTHQPERGKNLIWDYSNDAGTNTIRSFSKNYDTTIVDGKHIENNLTEDIGQATVYVNKVYGYNTNGYFETGFLYPYQAYPIGFATGGANDSLIIPEKYSIYSRYRNVLKFPVNFGDTFSSHYQRKLDIKMTIAGEGLFNVDAYKISHIDETDSVCGWGKALINVNGKNSDLYDVLMIKSKVVRSDSFYLQGVPAPAQFLADFNVTQGMKKQFNHLTFWRENTKQPLLDFDYGTDIYFHKLAYCSVDNGAWITDIKNIPSAPNFAVLFPNPSTEKMYIMNGNNIYNYSIFNTEGKIIIFGKTQSNSSFSEINIANLKGIYFLNLIDETGNVFNEKFVVE